MSPVKIFNELREMTCTGTYAYVDVRMIRRNPPALLGSSSIFRNQILLFTLVGL